MGKGGGCVPSKKKHPIPTTAAVSSTAAEDEDGLPESTPPVTIKDAAGDEAVVPILSEPSRNLKLLIVFYSMYGHVEGLARRMKLGADSVDGVEAVLYRVPETLPDEVLDKMRAPPKDDSIPVIGSPGDLAGADGFLFGFPTRYGCMAAQMKAFFDSTGQLWRSRSSPASLRGSLLAPGLKAAAKRPLRKPLTNMRIGSVSEKLSLLKLTNLKKIGEVAKEEKVENAWNTGIGKETEVESGRKMDRLRSLKDEVGFFIHYLCFSIHVFPVDGNHPISSSWNAFCSDWVHFWSRYVQNGFHQRGSPYGAGVFAGDGTREPSETELALAEHQGKYMAAIVKRLARG
ncbi:hypothetical protein DH2020_037793 [Rehmannia glutinosa]|uniref:Flavodoxin-like domain-containing protein n=1 Tax=Rehmannia glutinosa TaxID=99300 RepID=A0ABR0V0Q9_REHGL